MRVMIGHEWRYHVRRVQPPAQPHFDHRELHARPRKSLKRQRCHALEVGWMRPQLPLRQQALDHRMNPRKNLREDRSSG